MLIHLLVHLVCQLLCHDFSALDTSQELSAMNGSSRSFYTYGKTGSQVALDLVPVSDREVGVVGGYPYPLGLPCTRDVGLFRLIGA